MSRKHYFGAFIFLFLLISIPITVFTVITLRSLENKAASGKPNLSFEEARDLKAFKIAAKAANIKSQNENLSVLSSVGKEEKQLVNLSKDRKKNILDILNESTDGKVSEGLNLDDATLAKLADKGVEIEKKVTLTGELLSSHFDDFDNPSETVLFNLLNVGGKTYSVYLEKDALVVNGQATVTGYQFEDKIIAKNIVQGKKKVLGVNIGPLKTAILLFRMQDSPGDTTIDQVRNMFEGNPGKDIVSYFKEVSNGQTTLVPTYMGPYVFSSNYSIDTGCNFSKINEAINQFLTTNNIDLSGYDRKVYEVECRWGTGAGGGMGGGDSAWMLQTVLAQDVNIHELGHTFTLPHSNYWDCENISFTPPGRFTNACKLAEYGDHHDVMGDGEGPNKTGSHFNAYFKNKIGWLNSTQYVKVTSSGTTRYKIAPHETYVNGPMGVEIPRGNSGTAFVIDFRQPIGFDSWMVRNDNNSYGALLNITKGANLKLISSGTYGISPYVIDMNPEDILTFDDNDSALEVGQTFTDIDYGITIKTVAVDASGVTVEVTVSSTCTHSTPTVSSNSTSGEALIENSKVYQLSITNNDSPGCKPQIFRVGENSRPHNAAFEVVPVPDKFTLNPGQTKLINVNVKFQQLALDNFSGTYIKNGIGLDLGVDVYPNVLSLPILPVGFYHKITRTTDITAPSAPTNLRVNRVGSSAAELLWEKPTQNNIDILGYEINRTLSSSGAAGSAQYSETNQATALNLLPSTGYTMSVRAFDKNGNFSPVSNSITITTPAKTDTTVPGQLTSLTASALGSNNVSLSWTAATDNTFIAFYFVNKIDLISKINLPYYKVYPNFNNTNDSTGIFSENLYNYFIEAYDGHGNSSAISTLKVTTKIQSISPTKTGDTNDDGAVTVLDLSYLLSKWGTSDSKADVNKDGVVNVLDLSALLGNWG